MSPTFAQLGVPESICGALARRGITEPFEIQAATIADTLAGRDVCGRAPTGSGKTLAFGIPLVVGAERAQPKRPGALVLAPTRELADQIHTELKSFAGPVRVGVVYGGVGYGPQFKALRQGVDILVACPGRLEDLIEQREVDLSAVDRVVLDEADRMADMGFMPAVRRLLDQTSNKRQTVLYSATLDGDVAKLTRDYQHNPVRHEVGEETPDIKAASHVFWNVSRTDRTGVTAEAVNAVWPAIVFCRTRHGSDRLARQLGQRGVRTAAIHGGRSQSQRTRALADFANGRVHALVATDVAARGIHVDGVASVVHFDPPEDHKTYVHRSGRTARAGEGGVVLSLVQPEQAKELRHIQRQLGLDEPFIGPDAAELRELSPTPSRSLSPSEHAEDADTRERRSRPPHQKHAKSTKSRHRRPKRRVRTDGSSKPGERADGRPKPGPRDDGRPKPGPRDDGRPKKAKNRKKASHAERSGRPKTRSGASRSSSNSGNRKARRAHLQTGGAR